MRLSRILLGAAAGFTLAYTAVRTVEALADRQTPFPAQARDPQRYGATRRALALTGFARSAAGLTIWAFALAAPAEARTAPAPATVAVPGLRADHDRRRYAARLAG